MYRALSLSQEFEDFEGNGAELRERVACELRISPERVKLLTGSREVANEETLTEDLEVTAMVAEGQELPEWCGAKMLGYSFTEVSGVGPLPENSEEIDAKLLGRVFMLALKRHEDTINRAYVKNVMTLGVSADVAIWDFPPRQEFLQFRAGLKLPPQISDRRREQLLRTWERMHQRASAHTKTCQAAMAAFLQLDHRLTLGSTPVKCYSRWESHNEEKVEKKGHHRIYGLRQAYCAVEFEKLLGSWIERAGVLDRVASESILGAWPWAETRFRSEPFAPMQPFASPIEMFSPNQEVDSEAVSQRFEAFTHVLVASKRGIPEAAWMEPYFAKAVAALMHSLQMAVWLLMNAALAASKRKASLHQKIFQEILRRGVMALKEAGGHVEELNLELRTFILTLADHRNDALRSWGVELLAQHFPEEDSTKDLLQKHSQLPAQKEMSAS